MPLRLKPGAGTLSEAPIPSQLSRRQSNPLAVARPISYRHLVESRVRLGLFFLFGSLARPTRGSRVTLATGTTYDDALRRRFLQPRSQDPSGLASRKATFPTLDASFLGPPWISFPLLDEDWPPFARRGPCSFVTYRSTDTALLGSPDRLDAPLDETR